MEKSKLIPFPMHNASERSGKKLGKPLDLILNVGNAEERIQHIPLQLIHQSPHQLRQVFSKTQLDKLVYTIQTSGVQDPILVYQNDYGYTLISGEIQIRAAQIAKQQSIPAIIKKIPRNQDISEAIFIAQLKNENLDPISLALGYRQAIKKWNLTQEELGKKIGRNRATIANSLRLLNLSVQAQEDLREGHITAGHARALLRLKPEKQQQLLSNIKKDNLNVRNAEEHARRMLSENPLQKQREKQLKQLSQKFNVKVSTSSKKPVLNLEFKSHKALSKFLDMFR